MTATTAHYFPRTTMELSSILGRKFFRKRDYVLDTGSTNEVFKALRCTLEGFAEKIARLDRLGIRFAIVRNGKNVGESEFDLSGTRTLKIVPVIVGSKRAGIAQTIAGAVLIVASFFSYLVASNRCGAVQRRGWDGRRWRDPNAQPTGWRPSSKCLAREPTELRLGSAKNTTASGNPVPICIGRRR